MACVQVQWPGDSRSRPIRPEHDSPRSTLHSQSFKEGQPPEDATAAGEAGGLEVQDLRALTTVGHPVCSRAAPCADVRH